MILHKYTDTSYFVAPKARSIVTRCFYCVDKYLKNETPRFNLGPVHIRFKTLDYVVSSEAETVFFHNRQNVVYLRKVLMDLYHPQTSTLIKTDNSTATSLRKDTLKELK